jgi:hypothetical protein
MDNKARTSADPSIAPADGLRVTATEREIRNPARQTATI